MSQFSHDPTNPGANFTSNFFSMLPQFLFYGFIAGAIATPAILCYLDEL